MAKYLVLVEIDAKGKLLKTVNDIGEVLKTTIGDAIVTVEKAVNLEFIERIEGVQVWEPSEDEAGQPLPSVPIVQTKFAGGQYVDVILLPGDRPRKRVA